MNKPIVTLAALFLGLVPPVTQVASSQAPVIKLSAPATAAKPTDSYLTGNSAIGLGVISRARLVGGTVWLIDIKDIDSLLGQKLESSIEIKYIFGPAGEWAHPSQDWVGKMVLFFIYSKDKSYSVVSSRSGAFDFSPNGSTWYVWEKDTRQEIEAIKKVAAFFYLDPEDLRSRLLETVEDETSPAFLKGMAISTLYSRAISENKNWRTENTKKFITWRDSPRLPINLRLLADQYAGENSPSSYWIDPQRLQFLKSVITSEQASVEDKKLAQYQLDTCQQRN